MKIPSENYRGIEFVRLSSLPEEQKNQIWQAVGRDKIIKILRNNVLLNDCLQYADYVSWYNRQHTLNGEQKIKPIEQNIKSVIKIA
ncbi:MAG: hypothetical protein HC811_05645 [Flammeovirgaceae bacterium]|nr:hypothetical protein [Flammeovirgaceae bacterium]